MPLRPALPFSLASIQNSASLIAFRYATLHHIINVMWSGKPLRAEELRVSENNLYNWRKQLREKADNAFSNQPRLDEKELEIRQLKARVSELEEEREILKKAAVFFAKEESQRSTRWLSSNRLSIVSSGYAGPSVYRRAVITAGSNIRLVNDNGKIRGCLKTLNEYSGNHAQLTVLPVCSEHCVKKANGTAGKGYVD